MRLLESPGEPRTDFIQHLQRRHNVSRREARAMLVSWMAELATAQLASGHRVLATGAEPESEPGTPHQLPSW